MSFVIGIILTIFFPSTFAQEGGGPLPPPVEIEFTAENTPIVGEEVTLKLIVIPLEDIHADISCLLPEGVRLVEEGVTVCRHNPHDDIGRYLYGFDIEDRLRYTREVQLWSGPLEGRITKEFFLQVVVPDKKRYELIIQVEILGEWLVKEKSVVIDID